MLYNNPYAMGTMSPGTLGIMKGMGLGGQQGQINPMRQAEQGQLLSQKQSTSPKYPDVGQMAGMAKMMGGASSGGVQNQDAFNNLTGTDWSGEINSPSPSGAEGQYQQTPWSAIAGGDGVMPQNKGLQFTPNNLGLGSNGTIIPPIFYRG